MSWASRADRIRHDYEVPLFRQVANDLIGMIKSKELPPGARLPAEPELAEIYGVARGTVRRAVMELRKEKLVVVVHGRGTYVPSSPEA